MTLGNMRRNGVNDRGKEGDQRARAATAISSPRLGSPDLITDRFESIEILSLKVALGQREGFMRQLKRQPLRNSPRLQLKVRINVGCRVQVACIPHSVIGDPKTVDKRFPG